MSLLFIAANIACFFQKIYLVIFIPNLKKHRLSYLLVVRICSELLLLLLFLLLLYYNVWWGNTWQYSGLTPTQISGMLRVNHMEYKGSNFCARLPCQP